jgi:RecA-family ATPase
MPTPTSIELSKSSFIILRRNFTIHKCNGEFFAFYDGKIIENWGNCNWEELAIRLRSVRPEYTPKESKIEEAKLFFESEEEKEEKAINPTYHSGKIVLKDFNFYKHLKPDKNFMVDTMIYPNTTTMIYSPPGQFKSLLGLHLAMSVSSGNPFLGMKTKKYPVILCDKENNDQLIKDRLLGLYKGQGYKVRNFKLKFLTRNGDLMNEGFVESLKEKVKEEKARLIIFDTLHRFADYEENKADDLNRIYSRVFQPIMEECNCSIIFLHHSKKEGGYRGSSDLLGMVDTCYSVYRQGKSGKFELNCEKSRAGEIENIIGEIDFSEEQIRIKRLSEVLVKKEKTAVFRASIANIESIFFGKDLKLTRKEVMERLEMEKIEFSRATVTRALAWCVEEKHTLVKETKVNAKGQIVETGRYMNPPKVEINYVVEENKEFGDFQK